jgi:hypothetical protein
MKISTSTAAIVIALVGVALVSAAPATGDGGGANAATPASAAAGGDDDKVIVRRDGSKAVPFVANLGPSSGSTQPDGFDWGDAAISAGGAVSVMLVASGLIAVTRRRDHPEAQPTVAA